MEVACLRYQSSFFLFTTGDITCSLTMKECEFCHISQGGTIRYKPLIRGGAR